MLYKNAFNVIKPMIPSLFLMGLRSSSLLVKFVFTIFLAKYLTFSDVGLYGLFSAFCIISPIVLGLSIMACVSRNAVTSPLNETLASLKNYALYLFLLYSAIASVAVGLYVSDVIPILFILFLLVLFLENINIDVYNLALNLSRPVLGNILHSIRTAGWMIFYMVFAAIYPDLRNMQDVLLFWLGGNVASIVMFLLYARDWDWSMPSGDERSFRKWFKKEFLQARVYYVNALFNGLSIYAGQFVVSLSLGLEANGVFVYFQQIISALYNLLQTGVIQLAKPKLVKAYKEKDEVFYTVYKNCRKNTNIVALLMAVTALPAMYFITLQIGKSLPLEWFWIFVPMLGGFILYCNVDVGNLVFYSRHDDMLLLKTSVISGTAGIIISMCLVPYFGLWGAALSMSGMSVIALVYQAQQLRRIFST